MDKNKLMVFMIDALCETDVAYMRTLKNFGWILENGALVREMLPVYPSFTYPCHVSIMTGCYPNKHGIPHNEHVKAGVHPVPWYSKRSMVKKKFFAEYAKEHGYSTCLINWPVSEGADVDINLPMCLPPRYRGDNPRMFYEGSTSKEVLDRYFWKYGYLLCGCNKILNSSYDDFTNAVSPDIIRDYGQPDVMFVKMCDLDTVRHKLGVDNDSAKLQLQKHDCELGVLMESNPADEELRQKVYRVLLEAKDSGKYGLGYVFTKEEADERFHLTGPFDFIIEGEEPLSFGYDPAAPLFTKAAPGDYKTAPGTHGGLPWRDHRTTFFACGPAFKKGAVIEQACLVDEAPTMAKILGFEMEDIDGKCLDDILR